MTKDCGNKVRENQNIKVFANKYGLDLKDLMTLNYITDDSEILYEWQEIFINLSEEKANNIPWFIDKAQPDLSIPVVKPKTTTKTTGNTWKTTTKTTTKTTNNTSNWGATAPTGGSGKIVKKWTYNANINNGFYRGHGMLRLKFLQSLNIHQKIHNLDHLDEMLHHGIVQRRQQDILYQKRLVLILSLFIVNYVHLQVMYEL